MNEEQYKKQLETKEHLREKIKEIYKNESVLNDRLRMIDEEIKNFKDKYGPVIETKKEDEVKEIHYDKTRSKNIGEGKSKINCHISTLVRNLEVNMVNFENMVIDFSGRDSRTMINSKQQEFMSSAIHLGAMVGSVEAFNDLCAELNYTDLSPWDLRHFNSAFKTVMKMHSAYEGWKLDFELEESTLPKLKTNYIDHLERKIQENETYYLDRIAIYTYYVNMGIFKPEEIRQGDVRIHSIEMDGQDMIPTFSIKRKFNKNIVEIEQ